MKKKLAPSILSADFRKLGEEVSSAANAGAQYIHIDVMDGMFVPSISFGMPVIRSIRPVTDAVFDVHLMVQDPERYVEEFARLGADLITVHAEATKHLDRTLQQIHSLGKKTGVALNPATPLSVLDHVLYQTDMVLLMTVNPGFGGQTFMSDQLSKIAELRKIIQKKNITIEVDGGINLETAELCVQNGAGVLVAGNSIFKAANPAEIIKKMQKTGEK